MSTSTSTAAPLERAALATRELRHARARKLVRALALWVGTPTLLAIVYYGFVATPQYESVAVVAVEGAEPAERAPSKRAAPAADATSLELVREHVLSRAVVDELAHDDELPGDWAGSRVDWWSRLGGSAGREKMHAYYQDMVRATVDVKGTTLTLAVRAFSGRRAQRLARAIVASAEQRVRRTSERTATALTKVADERVAAARQRLLAARGAAGAPADADASFALELAREDLSAALRGRELVEQEVARRHRTLVVVAEPSQPDSATYPRRLWSIATVFFCALALMGILGLLGAAVREHAHL